MKTYTALCFVLLTFVTAVAQRTEYDVKISHVGQRAIAITCKDGADPTVDMVLTRAVGTIVVSCGTK